MQTSVVENTSLSCPLASAMGTVQDTNEHEKHLYMETDATHEQNHIDLLKKEEMPHSEANDSTAVHEEAPSFDEDDVVFEERLANMACDAPETPNMDDQLMQPLEEHNVPADSKKETSVRFDVTETAEESESPILELVEISTTTETQESITLESKDIQGDISPQPVPQKEVKQDRQSGVLAKKMKTRKNMIFVFLRAWKLVWATRWGAWKRRTAAWKKRALRKQQQEWASHHTDDVVSEEDETSRDKSLPEQHETVVIDDVTVRVNTESVEELEDTPIEDSDSDVSEATSAEDEAVASPSSTEQMTESPTSVEIQQSDDSKDTEAEVEIAPVSDNEVTATEVPEELAHPSTTKKAGRRGALVWMLVFWIFIFGLLSSGMIELKDQAKPSAIVEDTARVVPAAVPVPQAVEDKVVPAVPSVVEKKTRKTHRVVRWTRKLFGRMQMSDTKVN